MQTVRRYLRLVTAAAFLVVAVLSASAYVLLQHDADAQDRDLPSVPRVGTIDNPLTPDEVKQFHAEELARERGISVDEAVPAIDVEGDAAEISIRLESTLPDRLLTS